VEADAVESKSLAEPAMMPLDPRYVHVLRLRSLVVIAFAVVPGVVLNLFVLKEFESGSLWLIIAAAVLALVGVVILPGRRYRAWAWGRSQSELHIASGLLIRRRTYVPFGRVQHIDVTQGPIERRYGLATLTLHTAGTRAATVALPGLERATADRLRDTIRQEIATDLASNDEP